MGEFHFRLKSSGKKSTPNFIQIRHAVFELNHPGRQDWPVPYALISYILCKELIINLLNVKEQNVRYVKLLTYRWCFFFSRFLFELWIKSFYRSYPSTTPRNFVAILFTRRILQDQSDYNLRNETFGFSWSHVDGIYLGFKWGLRSVSCVPVHKNKSVVPGHVSCNLTPD